ncbi:MAG: DUF4870 domain-containing protein [Anaerolineae bacterium]|nr:DUF4870 domain-containing protein [Anaerolineae bacterium]MDW8102426.1 DUF4870 domain-containing protein [Anaerolineae bacterium]
MAEEKALPAPLSPSEERRWAMWAHLSVLLNIITGSVGVFVPLVIYLIYKERSRYVAFQSLQAFIFQLLAWLGAGILAGIAWGVTIGLGVILVGCLCLPIAVLLSLIPLGALVYGVIGGIQCNQGLDFRYWFLGDWLWKQLEGP